MCKIRSIIFVSIMLLLAACGQSAPSAAAPSNSPSNTPESSVPSSPIPAEPSPQPDASAEDPSRSKADYISDLARAGLANTLTIGIDAIQVLKVEEVEWSDASLGCPQPGYMYPQVIVEGYLVELQVGETKYAIHSDSTPSQLILCSEPAVMLPVPQTEQQQSEGGLMQQPIEEQTRIHLANQLGISVDEVTIAQIEETEWNNSSLGCPDKDVAYLEVITPGYIITLEAQGQQYRYHTDTGRHFVQCNTGAR
jgi:hypothetical protein